MFSFDSDVQQVFLFHFQFSLNLLPDTAKMKVANLERLDF